MPLPQYRNTLRGLSLKELRQRLASLKGVGDEKQGVRTQKQSQTLETRIGLAQNPGVRKGLNLEAVREVATSKDASPALKRKADLQRAMRDQALKGGKGAAGVFTPDGKNSVGPFFPGGLQATAGPRTPPADATAVPPTKLKQSYERRKKRKGFGGPADGRR